MVPAVVRSTFPNGTGVVRGLLRDPSVAPSFRRQQLWDGGYQVEDDQTIAEAVEQVRLGTSTCT